MHLCEPSPQRTPVLYQAGSSTRGTPFRGDARRVCVRERSEKEAVKEIVDDIRAQAVQLGRRGEDVKVFLGATLIVGRTDAEAQERFEEYRRYVSSEGALAHAAASLGIDFARYDIDEPIETGKSQAIVSNVEAMTRSAGPQWTRRKLLEQMVLGSRQTPWVGSAGRIADLNDGVERRDWRRRFQLVAHGRA